MKLFVMNIAFCTLGCKVNQYETQVMRELLESEGHDIVDAGAQPDVFIINSCTVTAESDRKTRQLVRKYRRLMPHAVIVLAGCMPQAFPEEAKALEEADIVLGNTDSRLLTDAISRYLATGQRVVEVTPHEKAERFRTPPITGFSERTRAFMKIEDGCDRYCSYCIIPTARGRVRSKPVREILEESEALAAAGYTEIVLVGINLSAYGKDSAGELCDAVEAAASVPGIKRVRLGSLEPDQISDRTLDRLAAVEKFCPQFHLSLQSGCDATLRRMNRHYDSAFYRDLVARIRARFPEVAVTTDIMVGFPGETEDEFLSSLHFVEEIGFAKAHVFAYSKRAGTKAAMLPDQVTGAEKQRRSGRMIAAAHESQTGFLKAQIGRHCNVLFETCHDGIAEGHTENYLSVKVPGDKTLCGKILPVKIFGVENERCLGLLL